jgi:hypothetical protein
MVNSLMDVFLGTQNVTFTSRGRCSKTRKLLLAIPCVDWSTEFAYIKSLFCSLHASRFLKIAAPFILFKLTHSRSMSVPSCVEVKKVALHHSMFEPSASSIEKSWYMFSACRAISVTLLNNVETQIHLSLPVLFSTYRAHVLLLRKSSFGL